MSGSEGVIGDLRQPVFQLTLILAVHVNLVIQSRKNKRSLQTPGIISSKRYEPKSLRQV